MNLFSFTHSMGIEQVRSLTLYLDHLLCTVKYGMCILNFRFIWIKCLTFSTYDTFYAYLLKQQQKREIFLNVGS